MRPDDTEVIEQIAKLYHWKLVHQNYWDVGEVPVWRVRIDDEPTGAHETRVYQSGYYEVAVHMGYRNAYPGGSNNLQPVFWVIREIDVDGSTNAHLSSRHAARGQMDEQLAFNRQWMMGSLLDQFVQERPEPRPTFADLVCNVWNRNRSN